MQNLRKFVTQFIYINIFLCYNADRRDRRYFLTLRGIYAKFIVSTDSTADLYASYVKEHDVRLAPLTFTIEKGGVMTEYLDAFTDYSQYVDFFRQLREKATARTSMLNYESHYNHFKKMAEEGATDVLHFTISTGLASTINVARQAAADVKKEFPAFNLKPVDSLAATIGQGELVYEAVRLRDAGKTLDEAYKIVSELPLHFQYVIAANDLFYLQRGGRVSAAAAVVGSALGVKPVLSFTREGKLSVVDKVRGMKKSSPTLSKRWSGFSPSRRGASSTSCIPMRKRMPTSLLPPSKSVGDTVPKFPLWGR